MYIYKISNTNVQYLQDTWSFCARQVLYGHFEGLADAFNQSCEMCKQ